MTDVANVTGTANAPGEIQLVPPPGLPPRGTNSLLIGVPGSGKTTSLVTFLEAGIELFVLITDPGGDESLLDAVDRRGLDRSLLHTHYIAPVSADWSAFMSSAQRMNTMGYKDLTEIKTGIDKNKYQQFYSMLQAFQNFTCDLCGESFGDVCTWGPERALAVDSLSGINTMAMDMVIGGKPAAHQGEWGVAMNAEEKLIYKLCADTRCFFVLTGHLEKEMDESIGKPMFMIGALGRKLAPKLPRTFSDVMLAKRDGSKFLWSTTDLNTDLKNRTLPLSDHLDPTFVSIVDVWRKRHKLA